MDQRTPDGPRTKAPGTVDSALQQTENCSCQSDDGREDARHVCPV